VHRILSNDRIAPDVHRLWIEAPHVVRRRQPGQFAIVRVHDEGERIPLTIADTDGSRGAIALIVQAVGRTTHQLAGLAAGAAISDVAGPLGRPTHIVPGARVCAIGGGIGTAVVYPIAVGITRAGGHVTVIIGGRSKHLVLLEREMAAIAERVIVTTDDGSHGRSGLVTDALSDLLAADPGFDEVIAVGPVPMMRAVCEVTRPGGLRTTVSLNPIMVDGTGMCGGCRVLVDGQARFVCVDGPEFDGHLVDFDELTARLAAYRDQERRALDRYAEDCRAAADAGAGTQSAVPSR
jgi:ferredoxin--NADP+ reductase